MTDISRQRQWQIRTWAKNILFYGSRCNNPQCQRHYNLGLEPLEFAHIRENGIKGNSRGQDKRIRSVHNNIRNMKLGHDQEYILLCKECHARFDGRENY